MPFLANHFSFDVSSTGEYSDNLDSYCNTKSIFIKYSYMDQEKFILCPEKKRKKKIKCKMLTLIVHCQIIDMDAFITLGVYQCCQLLANTRKDHVPSS